MVGQLSKVRNLLAGAGFNMARRGGAILGISGQRLQKLADAQREEARKEALKRRLSDQLYFAEPEQDKSKRRKGGKPKGATHGRDANERATFGSVEGYDRNGLTQRERDSMQPGDDPRRDGVGNHVRDGSSRAEGE